MKNFGNRYGWILLIGMACSGCSHLTEWYACGVNCQYHPRPPLPYQQYPEGVCHSHVVAFPSPSWQAETETESKKSENDSNSESENQKEEPQSSDT